MAFLRGCSRRIAIDTLLLLGAPTEFLRRGRQEDRIAVLSGVHASMRAAQVTSLARNYARQEAARRTSHIDEVR